MRPMPRRGLLAAGLLLAVGVPVVTSGPSAGATDPAWWFGGLGPVGYDPEDAPPVALAIGGQRYLFWYENFTAGPGEYIGQLAYARYAGGGWVRGVLDGFGHNDADDAGYHPVALWYLGQPHLFYGNLTPGTGIRLRHAWLASGSWHFADLPAQTDSTIAAVVYQGTIHLWTADHTGGIGRLVHTWLAAGTWRSQVLDGAGGPAGRVTGSVGDHAAVLLDGGWPHVFYRDMTHGNLRQAWLTSAGWRFATLAGTNGRVGRDVGSVTGAAPRRAF